MAFVISARLLRLYWQQTPRGGSQGHGLYLRPAQQEVATRRLLWPQRNAGMQIAVREFKNRLSELLKRAEAGEEIVVTSHGRPIARLGPVAACAPPDPVASLRRLRSQPWLRPSDGQPILSAAQPVPPGLEGEPLLSDLMLADRE